MYVYICIGKDICCSGSIKYLKYKFIVAVFLVSENVKRIKKKKIVVFYLKASLMVTTLYTDTMNRKNGRQWPP